MTTRHMEAAAEGFDFKVVALPAGSHLREAVGFKTVYNVNLTQGYFYFVRGVATNNVNLPSMPCPSSTPLSMIACPASRDAT